MQSIKQSFTNVSMVVSCHSVCSSTYYFSVLMHCVSHTDKQIQLFICDCSLLLSGPFQMWLAHIHGISAVLHICSISVAHSYPISRRNSLAIIFYEVRHVDRAPAFLNNNNKKCLILSFLKVAELIPNARGYSWLSNVTETLPTESRDVTRFLSFFTWLNQGK